MFRRKKREHFTSSEVCSTFTFRKVPLVRLDSLHHACSRCSTTFCCAFCRRIVSFISQRPVPTHTYNVLTTSYRCHFHAVGMFRGNLFDIFSLTIFNLCHFHIRAFPPSHVLPQDISVSLMHKQIYVIFLNSIITRTWYVANERLILINIIFFNIFNENIKYYFQASYSLLNWCFKFHFIFQKDDVNHWCYQQWILII